MMTAGGRKSPVHVHVDRETPVHVHLKKKKKSRPGVPTAVEVRCAFRAMFCHKCASLASSYVWLVNLWVLSGLKDNSCPQNGPGDFLLLGHYKCTVHQLSEYLWLSYFKHADSDFSHEPFKVLGSFWMAKLKVFSKAHVVITSLAHFQKLFWVFMQRYFH